jgi:hypothetical protein
MPQKLFPIRQPQTGDVPVAAARTFKLSEKLEKCKIFIVIFSQYLQ